MDYVSKYIDTLNLIEVDLKKIKIKTDSVAVKASATLLVVALDHAQGIKFCLQNQALPSAFALLRVFYETYMRGMWVGKCANEEQLETFIGDDRVVSKKGKRLIFADMALEVEEAYELPEYFSKINASSWDGLNSLTHSGSIQLHRNFNGNSIQHSYHADHIKEAIDFSTMLSCMAFAGLCDIATNRSEEIDPTRLFEFVQTWAFSN